MSSTPIKKQPISLIFLLSICLSMLFGTAANGFQTLHVPSGASTFGHKFLISWGPPHTGPYATKVYTVLSIQTTELRGCLAHPQLMMRATYSLVCPLVRMPAAHTQSQYGSRRVFAPAVLYLT